jgi:quinol---cytochrome-c reductase cytochrome c subunit
VRATLALIVLLAAPALAVAATPGGVVRPSGEGTLSQRELGRQLFAGNCASCHGSTGGGITRTDGARGVPTLKGEGPSLRASGALAADFYLRTGYMPLSDPRDQPTRSRPLFTARERRALVAYVASLGNGPAIPHPRTAGASLPRGQRLFTEHCAGCHQVAAEGGIVTGARVPQLKGLSSTEIAEAVRTGPYLMPHFSRTAISDRDLAAIVAYVQSVDHPDDPGGWGIDHLGPLPEGAVAWLLAGAALVGLCMVIGRRLRS